MDLSHCLHALEKCVTVLSAPQQCDDHGILIFYKIEGKNDINNVMTWFYCCGNDRSDDSSTDDNNCFYKETEMFVFCFDKRETKID